MYLHLHNLFAKSYNDISQIPVQRVRIKMNKEICANKVINNCGIVNKTVNCQGYSKLREPIKTGENCFSLIW